MTPVKLILLILIVWDFARELICCLLSDKQLKRPTPEAVADVYDAASYEKWLSYRASCRRVALFKAAVGTVFALALFGFDLFALVYNAVGIEGVWGDLLLMVMYTAVSTLIELPFEIYSTFTVEEKYGFNKSTKKTFAVDQIKSLILGIFLMGLLTVGVHLGAETFGIWLILVVFAALCLILAFQSLCPLTFFKIFYKFSPLPEGELRDRILSLFERNGYTVRKIFVMNASKRTTRANAFCTGSGRAKKIALFDNLVGNYPEDEIVAVFAHELGHDRHKDTTVLLLWQLVVYAVLAAAVGLTVLYPTVSRELGFEEFNATVSLTALLGVILQPVMRILNIPANVVSRRMEYRADAFAAEEGLGDALCSSLKRLSRDNFSNLNPHPLLSFLEDSHPPVYKRIERIRTVSPKNNGGAEDDSGKGTEI